MSKPRGPYYFFGQFLVAGGHVTPQLVEEAVARADNSNRPLGDYAIAAGYVDTRTVVALWIEQRDTNRFMGQLLIDGGHITEIQLEELLAAQDEDHIRIGEELVTMGLISDQDLEPLLAAYHAQIPSQLSVDHPSDALTQAVNESFPAVLERLCKLRSVLRPRPWPVEYEPFLAELSLPIGSVPPSRLSFGVGRTLGKVLCASLLMLAPDECDDELMVDGLGEFLNIVAGYLRSGRTGDAMGFPEPGPLTKSGVAWDMVTPYGNAIVVLSPM